MAVSPSNIIIDSTVDSTSTNPVQNQAIYNYLHDAFYSEDYLEQALAAMVGNTENYDTSNAALRSFINSAIKNITPSAFAYRTKLITVQVPNCRSIGLRAFSECSLLNTVEAKKVSDIGDDAFFRCTRLRTVDFSGTGSDCKINWSSFEGCSALSDIYLGRNVDLIYGGEHVWTITGGSESVATLTRMLQFMGASNPTFHVPSAMVSSYQSDAQWGNNDASLASLFVAIE